MEIRRLTADDYDRLLSLLNGVFAAKYKRDMDFLNEQPKMWQRDDEHMQKHIGIFENGYLVSVVGIYPLKVNILGEELLFATTGNVATLPGYEGRGYFTKLFSIAMDEIEKMGVDAARLGGARQRYARFGFEPAGTSFKLEFSEENRIKYFCDRGSDVQFIKVERGDLPALEYIDGLIRRKKFFVERGKDNGYLDLYRALGTKHSACYLAKKGERLIGYVCAACDNQFVGIGEFGRNITEYGYECDEDFFDMLSAYQRKTGSILNLTVAPHETELLEKLTDGCEYCTLVSPSRFKILNYEKIANALMKLKAEIEPLPFSEAVIEIENYGRIMLYNSESGAGAVLTDAAPDLSVTRAESTRLMFGHLPTFATKNVPESLRGFLPLPLSWNTLDYV